MKEYPSISRTYHEIPNAYIFDKLEGQNIRAEWTKKGKWGKFGGRHRLFDESDHQFGAVKPLFFATMADELERIAVDMRWERVIFFAEYWGAKTLAEIHAPGDQMFLTLFDVNPHKQGILGPRAFLKLFGDSPRLSTAAYLGTYNWTRGFVDRVWEGDVPGITLEGVVGKAGDGHSLTMAKAKTRTWIELIKAQYNKEEAEKLINS